MYFNVNFNVLFKLIKVHLLVSELYIYENARCKDKKIATFVWRSDNFQQKMYSHERKTPGIKDCVKYFNFIGIKST